MKYNSNNSMKKLLETANHAKRRRRLERMISKTVLADSNDLQDFGDLIIQKKNASDAGIGMQAIIEKYHDLTGYEYFCNETYIQVRRRDDLGRAVVLLLKCLTIDLNYRFPHRDFCVIISVDTGEYIGVTAHYHLLRDGEFVLDRNLENYEQPVLYSFINGNERLNKRICTRYDRTLRRHVWVELTYDFFSEHIGYEYCFTYKNQTVDIANYVDRKTKRIKYHISINDVNAPVENARHQEFDSPEELLENGRIDGKTIREVWDDLENY